MGRPNSTVTALLLLTSGCGGPPSTDAPPPALVPDFEELVGCLAPEPTLTAGGLPTGFVRCSDGSINRVEAGHSYDLDSYEGFVDACLGDGPEYEQCLTDDDCDMLTHGRCVGVDLYYAWTCSCSYLCGSDADCNGWACVPGELLPHRWSTCGSAFCETNADCPSGECGLSLTGDYAYRQPLLACRSSEDECRTDADCRALDDWWKNHCEPGQYRWECTDYHPYDD
jgi:hypothetical protein